MEYLKVWTSFREAMKPLNDAEKGRLFDAMLLYAETGEEPGSFAGNERFLWAVAKQDIDRISTKCERLRANGSKGGIAKAWNRLANDSKPCQTVANDSNSEQSTANDSLNNIKKSNVKKNNKNRFVPPTTEQVAEYCRERGNNVDADRFCAFYASKGWKVGNQPMRDWKAAVITWEKRDTAPAATKQTATQYNQRDYTGVNDEMRSQTDELMKQYLSERGAG